jgi:polyhydroxyalkanoate synthesis regulator phasin
LIENSPTKVQVNKHAKSVNERIRAELCFLNFIEILRKNGKLTHENGKLFSMDLIYEQDDYESLKEAFGGNNQQNITKLYEKSHKCVFENDQKSGLSYLFLSFNQNRQ